MPEYDAYNSTVNCQNQPHVEGSQHPSTEARSQTLRGLCKKPTLKSEQHTWSLFLNDLDITLHTDRANQENTVSQKSKNWEDSNIYLDSLVAN